VSDESVVPAIITDNRSISIDETGKERRLRGTIVHRQLDSRLFKATIKIGPRAVLFFAARNKPRSVPVQWCSHPAGTGIGEADHGHEGEGGTGP
jgi:hypothetical protein